VTSREPSCGFVTFFFDIYVSRFRYFYAITMMRPCCIKLATKAIHWRGNHAAAISHRLLMLPQGGVRSQRTLVTTPSTSREGGPPIQIKSVDESQQAIEKAEQLHKELNELIKAQKDRRDEEAKRPFGSGIIQFFKASKPEMFNIFFAFVCGECI